MIATKDAPQRARWAVMWVAVNGRRRVIRKDFKDDLASATELYLKAHDAGKPYATLACVNMGFPPPMELRPHTVWKRGRNKRTRKIETVKVLVRPLRELNMEGKLWCPYCRQIRKFVLRKRFELDGIVVDDPRYICPICKISNRDHHVRYWNPTADIHMSSALAALTRRPRTTRRRRRSR